MSRSHLIDSCACNLAIAHVRTTFIQLQDFGCTVDRKGNVPRARSARVEHTQVLPTDHFESRLHPREPAITLFELLATALNRRQRNKSRSIPALPPCSERFSDGTGAIPGPPLVRGSNRNVLYCDRCTRCIATCSRNRRWCQVSHFLNADTELAELGCLSWMNL